MKSQSIPYLLNESKDRYWILDLESEMHSIWDLWIRGLQLYKGNGFFKVWRTCNNFQSDPKKYGLFGQIFQLPLPESTSPKKFVGRNFTSSEETHLRSRAPFLLLLPPAIATALLYKSCYCLLLSTIASKSGGVFLSVSAASLRLLKVPFSSLFLCSPASIV